MSIEELMQVLEFKFGLPHEQVNRLYLYLRHDDDCRVNDVRASSEPKKCTCGLNNLLQELFGGWLLLFLQEQFDNHQKGKEQL